MFIYNLIIIYVSELENLMFSPDTLVVYPAHGVGVIERIDHKCISGVESEFYIVRIRTSNIVLMVPVQNASVVGLRHLVSKQNALAIFERLKENTELSVFTGQNWNRRFREYNNRLKSPELETVAEVLHELLLIGRGKELSFGERRLREQAMELVSGELAEVLACSADSLRDELLAIYAPVEVADA